MSLTSIRSSLNGPRIAIIDQTLVSATNFLTAILLARFLGIHNFGIYSLFFVFLILLVTIHLSVFSAPMMTLAQTMSDEVEQKRYLHSINTIQVAYSLIASAICIATVLLLADMIQTQLFHYLVSFSLCVFFVPIQEWLRKYLFAKQLGLSAFYLDSLKALIQIGLLMLYAHFYILDIDATLYIIASASAVTYIIGAIHQKLAINFKGSRHVFIKNWAHARHLLPSNFLEWVKSQGFLVLGGFLIGVQAVGAIRAAQNILGPLNVFYQAADNIFPVEGAKRMAKAGHESMVKYFKTTEIKGILLLSVPCIIISLASHWIMELFYGIQFGNYHTLIIWQAISLMLGFSFKLKSSFMRTVQFTKPILASTILSSIILIALITPFSTLLNEDGIMLAKIVAETSSLLFIAYNIRVYLRNSINSTAE